MTALNITTHKGLLVFVIGSNCTNNGATADRNQAILVDPSCEVFESSNVIITRCFDHLVIARHRFVANGDTRDTIQGFLSLQGHIHSHQ